MLAYHFMQIVWHSKVTRRDSLRANNYTKLLKCNLGSYKSPSLSGRNGRRSGDLAPLGALLEIFKSLTSDN